MPIGLQPWDVGTAVGATVTAATCPAKAHPAPNGKQPPAQPMLTRRRDVRRVQDPLLAPAHHAVPGAGAVGVLRAAAQQTTW